MSTPASSPGIESVDDDDLEVIVIGAGISGISAAYHLRTRCPDRRVRILEARGDLGGTWDLFRYPGVRSDSDMHTLGFAFKPWEHELAIADGPSLMAYLRETVEEFGISGLITYHRRVRSASWSRRPSLTATTFSSSMMVRLIRPPTSPVREEHG